MNFSHYTDAVVSLAADLANLAPGEPELQEPAALTAFLDARGIPPSGPVGPSDVRAVGALCARLRQVFDAADEQEAATLLNELLAEAGVHPELTDHDGTWHLHYAPHAARLAHRVAAPTAMALATLVAEFGLGRLKACESETCDDVYVDLSRNQSRRYCCDRCANRENVAAYRARRRRSDVTKPGGRTAGRPRG